MSSILSTGNAPAQRVPAWKRLGLKLKPASEEASQNPTLPTNTTAPPVPNHRQNPTGPTNAKRKPSGVPALDHSAKKARTAISEGKNPSQTPKKAKSVSFAAGTAAGPRAPANDAPVANKQNQQLSKKAASVPTRPAKKAPVNLEPALAYLRQWHSSKDTWRFNKNHQTRLLEQVFADETTIPAADINIFYEYIRGLQGAVRTRFRELAAGVKARDMEQGSEAFSAPKDMAEKKQKDYQQVIETFLSQDRTPEKRRFDEVDYVLRTADMEMRCRVVKRMRSEMVLDELSDSETTETASTATSTTTSTGKGHDGGETDADANQSTEDGVGRNTRLRLNDDPQQRVKRRRKTRTAVIEEEPSSESESESESESSDSSSKSSTSSSEDSDDDNAQSQPRANEELDSSSSSSSESSETDSESEDD
ncbi:hypothetical protein F4779DRAFT_556902 [Xylariaceae sp. FL0662B]|nr:hypothetical protein F4779DRAFT_556902 [Xylariaceae sp. FL0662B]